MDLIAIRKYLHAHPEVSGNEQNTSAYLLELLKTLNPDQLLKSIGGNGVAAVFDSGRPGKTLLFRAELDALPIEEENRFPHKSLVNGVSHKCGHDGHMAILLGLAVQLAAQRPNAGKVICIFQPAEETGTGARAMVQDPQFSQLRADLAFAIHNLPGYPLGAFVLKKGPITASVKSLIIKLKGKTAHAAEPENGINPAFTIATLIKSTQKMNVPDPKEEDFFLITPVYMELGDRSYGVAAGYGELHLTMRAWTEKVMEKKVNKLMNKLDKMANKSQIHISIDWTDEFVANTNDFGAIEQVFTACQELELPYQSIKNPLKWGEDFGVFTQKIPGAFIGLGAGENHPALHNPNYDFPDELIPIGVKLYTQLVNNLLP